MSIEDNFAGFLFVCNNGRLNQPASLSKKEISDIPVAGNSDQIYIRCKECDEYMIFTAGPEILSGKWRCPVCGRTVREETPYTKLEKINREFESKLFGNKF